MSSRLEKIREALKKEKSGGNNGGNRRADFYPFWLMADGKKAVVRILPDANEDNDKVFYVDKLDHRISINGKDRTIVCPKTYDMTNKCPICELSSQYYKAEGKESKNGKYYYRNKTSLVRLLVLSDPLPPNEETGETADGKQLNSQFSYQLMEKIKAQLASEELDDDPFDLDAGLNFNIIKSLKPGTKYADYGIASEFSRKVTAVPAEYRDEIELIDLSTLLPEKPTYESVKRLLDAHLNGSDEGEEGSEDSDEDEEDNASMRALMERRKAKAAAKQQQAEEDDEEDAPPPPKASKKPAPPVEADEDEEDAPPPPKASKKPAPPVEEDEEEEDLEEMMRQIKERRKAAASK